MDIAATTEFEYDWCACACDSAEAAARKLAKSRWLLCAQKEDAFFRLLVRFLHFADQRFDLGLSITLLVDPGALSAAAGEFSYAQVKPLDGTQAPMEADYCVYCGYAGGTMDIADEDAYRMAHSRMETFWQIARASRRSICISDGQIYGPYGYPLAAAEGEFLSGHDTLPRRFFRELEQKACRGEYVTLRPGALLAAGERLEAEISEFLDSLILGSGNGRTVKNTHHSVLYITDFLTAFLLSAVTLRPRQIYNVSAGENTVSILQLLDLASQLSHGELPQITVKNDPHTPSRALCGDKLRAQGWRPTVDLRAILTLYRMARLGEPERLWFTDGHQGKLPAIHRQLLRILNEVDRICKKHRIRYFLAGGTLLGAVRHQGFIPWDDDLDVMMLRSDYDRFMAAASQELSGDFFLQTPDTDPGCHYLISKIRLNGTVFSSDYLTRFPNLHNGLFVDIIAQDYTANHPMARKLHLKLSLLARGLVFKKWSGGSAAEIHRAYAVFDVVKKILPISLLEQFQDGVLRMFNRKKNRRFLYDSMGINIAKGAYPVQWLSESVELPFEGRHYPAPAEYEAYLRYLYGDYTRLPPVSRRKTVHDVVLLDMGPYAEATQVYHSDF